MWAPLTSKLGAQMKQKQGESSHEYAHSTLLKQVFLMLLTPVDLTGASSAFEHSLAPVNLQGASRPLVLNCD
jgi:hypothetical protein